MKFSEFHFEGYTNKQEALIIMITPITPRVSSAIRKSIIPNIIRNGQRLPVPTIQMARVNHKEIKNGGLLRLVRTAFPEIALTAINNLKKRNVSEETIMESAAQSPYEAIMEIAADSSQTTIPTLIKLSEKIICDKLKDRVAEATESDLIAMAKSDQCLLNLIAARCERTPMNELMHLVKKSTDSLVQIIAWDNLVRWCSSIEIKDVSTIYNAASNPDKSRIYLALKTRTSTITQEEASLLVKQNDIQLWEVALASPDVSVEDLLFLSSLYHFGMSKIARDANEVLATRNVSPEEIKSKSKAAFLRASATLEIKNYENPIKDWIRGIFFRKSKVPLFEQLGVSNIEFMEAAVRSPMVDIQIEAIKSGLVSTVILLEIIKSKYLLKRYSVRCIIMAAVEALYKKNVPIETILEAAVSSSNSNHLREAVVCFYNPSAEALAQRTDLEYSAIEALIKALNKEG